ncbi:MAG: glycosyltransferase family 2 protein, partial [Patescibacteria group bacterium]
MKLSAVTITKNEEANIARSIRSVSFTDEVLVVDAESSDQTVKIAQSLGAKTFIRPWPGYGPQRNFAAAQAEGDWLIVVDADEEITPELAQEIRTTLESPEKDFYWVKIITTFLGQPLSHLHAYNMRLIKKSAGHWADLKVHEQVQTMAGQRLKFGDSMSEKLKNPILHHSHKTVASYLKRMHRYTTLDAQQMAKENRHRSGRRVKPTWWLPYYLAKRQFIKLYFYKGGLLDSYAGFMWSLLSA